MFAYAVIGLVLLAAVGMVYADRSAVARVEGQRIARAAEVLRESTATVREESDREAKTLRERVAGLERESTRLRKEAGNLRRRAASAPSPADGKYCRPGCKVKW